MIGTPTAEDRSFVTDAKANDYLDTFKPKECCNFAEKYPAINEEGKDFLRRILMFNPYFRLQIDEALQHPFLKKVRKPAKEEFEVNNFTVPFEKEELDKSRLRELFIEQFAHFKALRTP